MTINCNGTISNTAMVMSNKIIYFSIGLALALNVFADQPIETSKKQSSFRQVYSILNAHCGACHIEGGAAIAAWTLDRPATDNSYPECMKADNPALCTTYLQLTAGDYPWMMAGNLHESPPYLNACVTEENYHIGVSIPERLSDPECDVIKNWILNGTKK